MKKFLNSDWLRDRAVQFFRNTVRKNEIQCKFLNFLNYIFLFFKCFKFLIKFLNVTYVRDCIFFHVHYS